MKAAIIGAGIGGLATALSFHEIGLDVDVFESVPQLRPLGVGINLLPHAVRELDELGLLDELRAHSIEPHQLLYCTRHGQEIWREPRGLSAGYPWPQISLHRGELQRILLDAALDRIGSERLHLGHRLAAIDDSGPRPVARFTDGREFAADLIVAADGIHSAARAQRYPDEGPALWNGSLLWRALVEGEPILDGRTMIWAGYPDQKFVAYPIGELEGGKQRINIVAEMRRPDSELGRSEDWNKPGSLDDFLPHFLDWRFDWLDVPGLLKSIAETYVFPMVDREPLARWTFGRTTLLGDAAHPMYPIGSNGASQAILDARVLAGCLRRHADDPDAALRHYEEARLPATAAIVRANRGLGPEVPMKLVHERAPAGFADIGEVITPDEIERVTEGYRRTAGFALAELKSRGSLIDDPY